MTGRKLSDAELVEKLNANPVLRERIGSLQVDEQSGARSRYLLDCYSVCEYLGPVARAMGADEVAAAARLDTQKTHWKTRRADEMICVLKTHLEPATIPDAEAPIWRCHRYLSQRQDQLGYQTAISRDLPIGSGEIESALPLPRAAAPETPRRLVAGRTRRAHARAPPQSRQSTVEGLLAGQSQQAA